jgi:hypothetical protein
MVDEGNTPESSSTGAVDKHVALAEPTLARNRPVVPSPAGWIELTDYADGDRYEPGAATSSTVSS